VRGFGSHRKESTTARRLDALLHGLKILSSESKPVIASTIIFLAFLFFELAGLKVLDPCTKTTAFD